MSRTKATFRYIHISLNIRMNDDDYSYRDPYAEQNISFSIPEAMFNQANFSALVKQAIEVLPAQFEAEKAKLEAQEKANEEAARLKAEAEVNV